jgi:hypothetical protein
MNGHRYKKSADKRVEDCGGRFVICSPIAVLFNDSLNLRYVSVQDNELNVLCAEWN